MAVTIKQVARKAKVSISTASVVLRGKPHPMISQTTIERIKTVARELNFHPNPTARSLQTCPSPALPIPWRGSTISSR